ncbi:MAG: hypothetical protein H6Q21_2432, partial [Bacteroidetes bacterium]|nr:hypothetical protein [Bacteroidota bacterium]
FKQIIEIVWASRLGGTTVLRNDDRVAQ